MTTTAIGPARRGLLAELDRPAQVFANITPNWYAAVMGTGIVAVAAASLPEQFPGLRSAATVVRGLAAALLVAVTGATGVHWWRHRETARGHARDPVMAHVLRRAADGHPDRRCRAAPAGPVGGRADRAVDADWALWLAGTALGLVTAAALPYLMFTRCRLQPGAAFGGWLMPVVPPMVSASTGALLIPYAPAGQARLALLLACYAMFGISLLASLIVITLIWGRPCATVSAPRGWSRRCGSSWARSASRSLRRTCWAPWPATRFLRPTPRRCGSSACSTGSRSGVSRCCGRPSPPRSRSAPRAAGLPFSLTWWSFTFPVGTCVTATTTLALATGSVALRVAAAAWYAAW